MFVLSVEDIKHRSFVKDKWAKLTFQDFCVFNFGIGLFLKLVDSILNVLVYGKKPERLLCNIAIVHLF